MLIEAIIIPCSNVIGHINEFFSATILLFVEIKHHYEIPMKIWRV